MEYKDIFLILGRNKIIPHDFVDTLVKMVKFRNLVVHGYLGVESKRVYEIIKSNLDDIEKFIKIILSRGQ